MPPVERRRCLTEDGANKVFNKDHGCAGGKHHADIVQSVSCNLYVNYQHNTENRVFGVQEMYRERNERLQIMLSPEELNAIDDWRFRQRMPSRASAVRELLRRGLQADGVEIAASHEKSSDFGVLEKRGDSE